MASHAQHLEQHASGRDGHVDVSGERQLDSLSMRFFRSSPPSRNQVNELASKLAAAGKTDQLEAELQRFNVSSLASPERESWYHLWGVAAFQRGDRPTALRRFEEAFTLLPASGQIAFSLGQEYEYTGQPAKAFALFDRFTFPSVSSSYALAQARYAYLWNELDRAHAYLAPIFDAYYKLKIADDHFVYMRGLPFFAQTWAYAAAIFELQGNLDALQRLTERAGKKLAEANIEDLRLRMTCLQNRNFQPLVEQLRARLEEAAAKGWPTGYLAMEAAAIEALAIDATSGRQRLTSIALSDADFAWLRDIRRVALAALAHAAGDAHTENGLLRDFAIHQPYLFEPDHAFNFRLLAYQEKLKVGYRRRRCGDVEE